MTEKKSGAKTPKVTTTTTVAVEEKKDDFNRIEAIPGALSCETAKSLSEEDFSKEYPVLPEYAFTRGAQKESEGSMANGPQYKDEEVISFGNNPWKLIHQFDGDRTEAMEIKSIGCVVRVNSSLTYISGAKIQETLDAGGVVINRKIVKA